MGPISERADRFVRQVFKKKMHPSSQREEITKRTDKLMEMRKKVMKRYKGG